MTGAQLLPLATAFVRMLGQYVLLEHIHALVLTALAIVLFLTFIALL